jgi:hypothetical protein
MMRITVHVGRRALLVAVVAAVSACADRSIIDPGDDDDLPPAPALLLSDPIAGGAAEFATASARAAGLSEGFVSPRRNVAGGVPTALVAGRSAPIRVQLHRLYSPPAGAGMYICAMVWPASMRSSTKRNGFSMPSIGSTKVPA